jgi:hypothetical protein
MARLGVTWFDDAGVGHDIAMGAYQPTGTDPVYELAEYGVPEESVVCSVPNHQYVASLKRISSNLYRSSSILIST